MQTIQMMWKKYKWGGKGDTKWALTVLETKRVKCEKEKLEG